MKSNCIRPCYRYKFLTNQYSDLTPEEINKNGWLQIVHPDERDENTPQWLIGIGLAIITTIVENHHEVITVKCEVSKGAGFDRYIPVDGMVNIKAE